MNQEEVLKILKRLGGEATGGELRDYVQANYPGEDNPGLSDKLNDLHRWGFVAIWTDPKNRRRRTYTLKQRPDLPDSRAKGR